MLLEGWTDDRLRSVSVARGAVVVFVGGAFVIEESSILGKGRYELWSRKDAVKALVELNSTSAILFNVYAIAQLTTRAGAPVHTILQR